MSHPARTFCYVWTLCVFVLLNSLVVIIHQMPSDFFCFELDFLRDFLSVGLPLLVGLCLLCFWSSGFPVFSPPVFVCSFPHLPCITLVSPALLCFPHTCPVLASSALPCSQCFPSQSAPSVHSLLLSSPPISPPAPHLLVSSVTI